MVRYGNHESCFQWFRLVFFLKIFLLFLTLQPSGLLAESLEEGARREGKVMFYSQATIPDIRALMSAFQKKYPFIKADFYRANTTSLLGKVLAEKRMGQTFADVVAMDGTFLNAYKKEGITGKYISPESKFIPQGFKDPEGFWTAYYMSYYTFAYNTKMVAKKDIPKNYDDLLNPRWRGKKIGLSDGDVEWYMGMLDFLGEEKGRQYIRRLADQDLMIRTGRTLLANLMVAGEFPITLGAVHTLLERIKAGAPIEIMPFPVPTLAGMRMIVIHANAPHPNAARLLMDFILSKDGQNILSQFSRNPVRIDILVDPAVQKIMHNSFPIKPRDMELVRGYQKEWDEIFKKR